MNISVCVYTYIHSSVEQYLNIKEKYKQNIHGRRLYVIYIFNYPRDYSANYTRRITVTTVGVSLLKSYKL